jgi:hypothetical protein
LLLAAPPLTQRLMDRDLPPQFLAAVGSQFALGCTMLNALCIRVFDEIEDKSSLPRAQQIMGFQNPSEVSIQRRRVVMSLV